MVTLQPIVTMPQVPKPIEGNLASAAGCARVVARVVIRGIKEFFLRAE